MSVDSYFGRVYNTRDYNCAHFARDVWRDLTGEDLSQHLLGVFAQKPSHKQVSQFLRKFKQSLAPVEPSIVIFQYNKGVAHTGVFIRGRVLHILETQGVRYDSLSCAAATAVKVRFYSC